MLKVTLLNSRAGIVAHMNVVDSPAQGLKHTELPRPWLKAEPVVSRYMQNRRMLSTVCWFNQSVTHRDMIWNVSP